MSEVPVWAPFSAWWERGYQLARAGAATGGARLPRRAGRVRASRGACAQLPAICFALRLRIGLSLKAAENEIIPSYRYGTLRSIPMNVG